MTDLIKRIISTRTCLLLFNFSIYFTLAHFTGNANWRNNEKQISNCNRIQIQCENERDMREQIFRCNNGACIPKTYKCDGVEHCCDGSDEWIQECQKTTGKNRKKRAADGHCIAPTPSLDKTIKYECDAADSKSCLVNGLIRENTLATIVCNPNYMPTNETHLESVCRKKKWIPSIDRCHKICKTLTPVNVNLQCSLENRPIACDENSLIAGVKVQPTCKTLYTYKGFVPEYNEITCHEDGNWSDMLFKCTAECGIQYAGIKLLISNGIKEQFGDSPWHVAVYDHKKFLICGGTIIHPQLILSAAHCFYDPRSSQKLKPEDFEIVVSKISRNYFTKDNDYQKAFKIREILVSDKGYNHLADYHSSDIVILVLKEKLTLSPTVLPACIDPVHMKRYPPEGTLAKVVGWGNDENGTLLEFLHTANLPFISRQRCIEVVPDDFKPYVTIDKFCAGSEEGAGVLQGDSGGGLLFQQGSFFYIRGIVSSKRIVDTKIAAFTDLASHVDWIIAVRDQIERENMESNPSHSQNTSVMTPSSTTTPSTISRNYCTVSASYSDKTVKYKCPSGGKNQSCVRNGGTEVSEFTKATVTCNSGYQLADNETLNWTCMKGSWLPEFPKCEKICDQLTPKNVDLACFRDNIAIQCKGPLITGDKVRPTCKPLHIPTIPAYAEELLCREDGKWDNILFECIPECGVDYTSTIRDKKIWSSNGTVFTEKFNDFPWHTSIYDVRTKEFICGGTIIHTSLILSAAQCFHNNGTRKQQDASNYEILVSKVTQNYPSIDNRFQASYKIKEIRYPSSSYSYETYFANDIALLIVDRKIIMRKSVLPACVNTNETEFNPLEYTAGRINEHGAALNYISNSSCIKDVAADFKPFITYDKFCAQFEPGEISSLPNRGSGWFSREGNPYYIKGVVSMKANNNRTSTVTFTKVANHVSWIKKVRDEIEKIN